MAKAGGIGPHSNSGTIVDIPQGTGESQRIGRKCTITDVYLRLNISTLNKVLSSMAVGTFTHNNVRIIMYLDRQCNGAQAAATDILQADVWNSYRNLSNKNRFRTLFDKVIVLNNTAYGGGNGTTSESQNNHKNWIVNIHKRCFIPIEFSSTTGALTEIRSNNIGILIWSQVVGRHEVSASLGRIRFIDY